MKARELLNGAATAMILAAVPNASFAESAVTDPGSFFATTAAFDPNASGTKYAGTMTIAYVLTTDGTCPTGVRVSNMFVVLTLLNGNHIQPFNTDFRFNSDPNPTIGKEETPSFCFIGEGEQIAFVLDMIRTRIVPVLYSPCMARPTEGQIPSGSCPDFRIKSIGNMQSSGHGSLRSDITIAVKQ